MLKRILRACLTQRQREEGLYRCEPDDHTVELKDKEGKQLAVFSSSATVVEIRKEADKHIGKFDIEKALEEISEPVGDIRNLSGPTSKEKLIEQVAAWIDTHVIAEMIIEHLGEQGEGLTFEAATASWCQTLEHLGAGTGLAR